MRLSDVASAFGDTSSQVAAVDDDSSGPAAVVSGSTDEVRYSCG